MSGRAFLSPIINPLVVNAVRWLLPFMMRNQFGGLKVRISDADLAKLRQYRGRRMLLLPNHPTGEEPLILFEVAKRLNEVFHFVAAREVFDWEHGFRGWVLRRVGAYSVIRGAADRDSFMMSRKILMEGLHRLVIFIEGEISRGNETLIPFEPGVIQLAFWAQECLAKEAAKLAKLSPHLAEATYPPVYVAPIAIKYFYAPGYDPAMAQALIDLEKSVGLHPDPADDRYVRIRAVGEAVLKVQEDLHQVAALPQATFTERVDAIRNRMLQKMELFLGLKLDLEAPALNRLREIRNTMDHMIHSYDDPADLSDYEKRMVEHLRLTLSEFYKDLDRVVYFLTYDETYLRENRSPERFIEMIRRLEREIYGEARLNHPRIAMVQLGKVLNLQTHFQAYEADKKGFVRQIAANLEEDMRQLILNMPNPFHLHPDSSSEPCQQ
ncbi:lysophospholipid acyltransferase family protein [Vampirovibrio sp.]|uniref:lysophospholipid acyltransferase family protein n=1 Tax=Vampirovibrio sp. TaxID=2717857 RepID=UPI003594533C